MARIKTKSGSLELSDDLDKMVKMILRNLAPNVEKIIRKEMGDIMHNAQRNWLVRSTKNQFGTFADKRSQHSADKFSLTVKAVSSAGKLAIKGAIYNSAPYAYAIRAADHSITISNSKSSVPAGKNLWNELVTKPVKKAVPEITKKITKELVGLHSKR